MSTPTDTRGPERFSVGPQDDAEISLGRAVLAGLALLALLVGVPVLLWLLTGPPPLPTGVPSREDLTQQIGVDTLLVVLRVVVWLAWLQFAVCTVVEAVSFVRGGGLPRAVPLSGPAQAAARALVGTVLVGASVLGSTGAASAAAELAPSPAETPSAAATAGDQGPGGQDEQAEAEQQEQEQAPRQLSVAGVPADMTDVIGKKVAIVKPPEGHYHDNLWDIAERHLGDGRRWKEIYELNQHRMQPDGQQLVLGRLIQPGWVLIMPNDATGLERVTEAPAQAVTPAPERAAETAAVQAAEEQATEDGSSLPGDLLAGGLLGGAVLGALLLERRRRHGKGADPETEDAEVALRAGADPERTAWLDRALRSLSAACRDHDATLPPVYAVTVSDERIQLNLAGQHHDAPGGWTVEDDGRAWVLDRETDLGDRAGHAPYPGLVCIGRDDSGADVLLDLESADGIVAVQGAAMVAREVVAALAVQLVTAPWADAQRVLGHDLGPALAEIGTPALEDAPDLERAVADLGSAGVQQPATQVLSGRLGRAPGQTPHYLVVGSLPDAAAADSLTALTQEGTRGLGIVVAGQVASSRWRATVDDGGRLSLPLLDVDVDAVRLGEDSAELLADLFADAAVDRSGEDDGRPPVPPTPAGAGDDSTWSSARVRVGVLGAVEVRSQGRMDEARLPLATELVTFLALQNEPVHPSVVGASVWPRGVTSDVRDATIARVRDWLGTDIDGNHLLRETEDGRLLLAPEVGVDWHAFCVLARRSRDTSEREEPELLRRALQLVRGPLLQGAPARRYSWVVRTGLEQRSTDLVVDVAHRLAELMTDDPTGGAAAARAGLRFAPVSQVLWRDLLRAESRGEDPEAVALAADEMVAVLEAAGVPVDAETAALVDELLPGRGEGVG